ncbi:hypothetical protein [Nostoc sp.]|uniref:hypothetical protein n=1 Tax=Nostoc sp. TaxID=1180 RepID=UPI002FFB7963
MENLIFVSAISAWEISIKQSLGKLIVPTNLEDALRFSRLKVLAITLAHGIKIADLPIIPFLPVLTMIQRPKIKASRE